MKRKKTERWWNVDKEVPEVRTLYAGHIRVISMTFKVTEMDSIN